MAGRRLDRPLDPSAPVGRPVRFRWDGRQLDALDGEPLAVALLAAGESTISRSFRFHRPRGLMCATGACGWCECAVDGLPSQRSCRVPVHEGLAAHGEHAWPSVANDLLGVLDRANRVITPGFYHHRFLKPMALRKPYLTVIRAFGGRGRIDPGPRTIVAPTETTMRADVVVVGAGPAGLRAALAAARAGARVVVLEAETEPGGAARWAPDADERAACSALADAAREALGDRLVLGTAVVARDGERVIALGNGRLTLVEAPVVIAATGSYERPPLVPGADRPGVIAARTVEWLVMRWGVVPGERAVIVGPEAGTERVARLLEQVGAKVEARVDQDRLVAVRGRGRVEAVRIRDDARARTVPADLVVFTARVPNVDLPLVAGAALAWKDGALCPGLAEHGGTSVPWLFVAGAAAGPVGDPSVSLDRASMAGAAAAAAAPAAAAARSKFSADPAPRPSPAPPVTLASVSPSANDLAGSTQVCYCEDVQVQDIEAEIAAGYDEPELLKRRTGALTGPCQGKYCLDRFMAVCARSGAGSDPFVLPTTRPPLAPVRLADLVTEPERGR